MTHTHLIFVVLLLLLFSPSLLCSDAEVKIAKGKEFKGDEVFEYLPVVSIYLSYNATNGTKFERLCGGSANKPFAILTSISCVRFYESKDWKEGAEHNITISFTKLRMLPFSVSFDNITVINHDEYDPEKPMNIPVDMALVFLPKNLTIMFSTWRGTKMKPGPVAVAGWGKVNDPGEDFRIALHSIKQDKINIVDMSIPTEFKECEKNKPIHNPTKYTADNGYFYCLKTEIPNAGPCVGDFGGPVFFAGKIDQLHLQVGILIESDKEYCTSATPGDYFPVLRVDKFSSWIEKNLKKYVPSPRSGSSSGLIFSPVLLGLSALVSLFLL